jgi:amino-acid N-acetyltransferase
MIRKANIKDIKQIQGLISYFAQKGLMLPRSINELYENIRDFWVYVENGKIFGCAALHVSWEDLAEVKSLVVEESRQSKGIGRRLLSTCLEEAKNLKIKKVFALTFKPKFFKKYGFKRIDKSKLPHKIWSECIKCSKFPDCDEVALMIKL